MTKGRTREQAVQYATESRYLVCPNRGEHRVALGPVIPLAQLEHGAYYHGKCRNAHIARWNAETQKFVYMREKFRTVFPEEIGYWTEGHQFDEFKPYGKLETPPFEIPITL